MSEVSNQPQATVLHKLFELLVQNPDGLNAKEAIESVQKKLPLRGFRSFGPQRFENILRFTTIPAVKAGWLAKNKGQWSVTEAGKDAFEKLTAPDEFLQVARQLYRHWKQAQAQTTTNGDDPQTAEEEAKEAARSTFEKAEEQAWAQIESHLQGMPPSDFQELVAELLRAMGYYVTWVAPQGIDGGLHILAWSDPLGTRPPRIKVQLKHLPAKSSVDGVRAFMALLGDDDVGLLVSIGGFTKDAEAEARTQEKRKITLVDLDRLFALWVEHYLKLSDDARRRLPLRSLHFLAPPF